MNEHGSVSQENYPTGTKTRQRTQSRTCSQSSLRELVGFRDMSKLDFANASVRSHRFLEDIVGVPVDEARPITPRRNASIIKMHLELGRFVGGVDIRPKRARIVEEVTLIIGS